VLLDHVVVPFACRLPLAAIPELHHITTMGLGMVDDRGDGHSSDSLAAETQGMLALEGGSGTIPFDRVATLACRSSTLLIRACAVSQCTKMRWPECPRLAWQC